MTTTLLTLTLVALTGADGSTTPRPKSSPYAPSLPYLTREEEKKLDKIIDRFMQFDIGLLPGAEGRQALREFERLGPEAIPALIRGLNRAAAIEHSCPVVVIAKKLTRFLMASDDRELLEFARDNIGAGVGPTRHKNVLADLRVRCMLRRTALARRSSKTAAATARAPESKSLKGRTVSELAKAVSTERGPRLRQVLLELSGRRGQEVLDGLCTGANSYDRDIQQFSRDLLDRHLGKNSAAFVKSKLKDDQAEVRKSAIRVIAARAPKLGGEVIALLTDDDAGVRETARRALVRISRGADFGPPSGADKAQREEAQQKWLAWWQSRRR